MISVHPGGAFVMVLGNVPCLAYPVFSPVIQKLYEVGTVVICTKQVAQPIRSKGCESIRSGFRSTSYRGHFMAHPF